VKQAKSKLSPQKRTVKVDGGTSMQQQQPKSILKTNMIRADQLHFEENMDTDPDQQLTLTGLPMKTQEESKLA